eukprot:m.105555 g.105555  ORF g.105555 m.105555 type:complete len:59 (+) comp9134_c0_seq1:404-580(+)
MYMAREMQYFFNKTNVYWRRRRWVAFVFVQCYGEDLFAFLVKTCQSQALKKYGDGERR